MTSEISAVQQVRRFNRHWTEVLGLLDEGLLETEHSLAEARVIFELAARTRWERLALRHRLGMDASFLTRVLTRLEQRGLVTSVPSTTDGRALDIALTGAGRRAFDELDRRSADQISGLLNRLTADQRRTITESMTVIRHLTQTEAADREVSVRGLGPGDLGWVVQRHGAVYADEFGWDTDFEALVAGIVSDYWSGCRTRRNSAWIAEVDGTRAGCVFCCEKDPETAQLRILLVEPWARGVRLGARLVGECVAFAADAGFARVVLWTNDVLVAARRIYEAAGFVLVDQEPHHSFGKDLVGQNWMLELR